MTALAKSVDICVCVWYTIYKQQSDSVRRLAPGGNLVRYSAKGVVLMNELNELLARLAELVKQLSALLDQIEYIAIKRNRKNRP